jgi:hypothetical protein
MTEIETAGDAAKTPEQSKKDEPISLSKFLEMVAPSSWRNIPDLWEKVSRSSGSTGSYARLNTPDITIHCPDKVCEGPRTFRVSNDEQLIFYRDTPDADFFLHYTCSNCRNSGKHFSVRALREPNGAGLSTIRR